MLYLAYGSNMNFEQMKTRCPDSKIVGTTYLKGWKLIFNVHADIIQTNDDNDIVPLAIWNISVNDLKMLDIYEGYPTYYIRKLIEVEIDGKKQKGIIYIINDKLKAVSLPYKTYFYGILDGYKDNNIDNKYLFDALHYTNENLTSFNKYDIINRQKNNGGGYYRNNKNKYDKRYRQKKYS